MPRGDFQLVTHPEHNPAVDFVTRSGQGPFVDTGVDVLLRPQPGAQVVKERVYLSVDTIRQLATIAKVVGEVSDGSRDAALIAQGKLEGLKEELGGSLADVARTLDRWLDAAGVNSGRSGRR